MTLESGGDDVPTYEYECPACHNRFEKRQSFSDPAAADCPACGAGAKRRLSVPAILFKGSGWYATDHRPSSFGSGGSSDSSGDSKTGDTETVAASTSATDDP